MLQLQTPMCFILSPCTEENGAHIWKGNKNTIYIFLFVFNLEVKLVCR